MLTSYPFYLTLFVQGFFYPHFSCVRARDLKLYDYLNNIKKNLVILFFCQKVNFCGNTGLWQKMVKKGLIAF